MALLLLLLRAKASNRISSDRCVSVLFDGGSRGNPGRAGYGYAAV